MVDTINVRRGSAAKRFLLITLLVLILGAGLWTWFSLTWSYSTGDRAGVLLKFSKKGWICKTYEGQLALYVVGGVGPQATRVERRAPFAGLDGALHRCQPISAEREDLLCRRRQGGRCGAQVDELLPHDGAGPALAAAVKRAEPHPALQSVP